MSEDKINWLEIINRIKANEQKAFAEFVDLTQKNVFQFCLHLTHNKQLAEDILHDTYIKAFDSIDQLKNENSVLAWMKQIARFLYLDYVKSSAHKNEVFTESWEELDTRTNNESAGLQRDVLKILNQLSEEDRTVLVLIDLQECSYEEAALTLEIAVGTVKSRLFRAREKFSLIFDGTKKQSQSS
jgi:RNA polymerase sigma-70 factor (ECF subfamily)